MSQSKHTPGPFEVQNPMGDDIGLWIVQAGLEAYEWSCIAIVPRDDDRSQKHFITKAEQKANAALFAAAPDLLEALKSVVAQVNANTTRVPMSAEVKALFDQSVSAIDKAEGKP